MTGLESLKVFQRNRDTIGQLSELLNARAEEVAAKATALQEDNKKLARELQQARMKAALAGPAGEEHADTSEVQGVKVVARQVSGLDKQGLRALVDEQRSRIKSGVVVLASPADGRVSIVVGVTPDLTKKVPAGLVVKEIAPIVGGAGGGRPDFAEAGGKDLSRISEMLAATRDVVEKLLKG
jgi:alanyl-tRNA synthetase